MSKLKPEVELISKWPPSLISFYAVASNFARLYEIGSMMTLNDYYMGLLSVGNEILNDKLSK